MCCYSIVSAQIAKGKIMDSDESILSEAYIINLNSDSHSHTNELGEFSIDKTQKGDVLRISIR